MSAPQQSYIIWMTQRVGSTLLCQALIDTGVAGNPQEHFTAPDVNALLAARGVADGAGLRNALWHEGTTANGVLGLKYGFVAAYHDSLSRLMLDAVDESAVRDEAAAWDAFFPRCKHVFLTRRNKVRLAVSWWRAINSPKQWHNHRPVPGRSYEYLQVPDSDDTVPEGLEDAYDYEEIQSLVMETVMREAGIAELFGRRGIVPHVVVYEDLVAEFAPTVRTLLRFLDVRGGEDVPVPEPGFVRIADDISERWVQRFREEQQAGSARKVW